MASRLPAGLGRRNPLYWWYIALEGMIFLEIAVAMVTVLWPWLTGGAADPTIARPAAAILGFAAVLMSWPYVKRSNREASRALA